MKIAIVTCRHLETKFGDQYYSFSIPLVSILNELNYLVLSIPNVPKDIERILSHIKPDLIVLAGGEDLDENQSRDLSEDLILDYAIENPSIKLFGICRGLQIMVQKLGGVLTPIPNHVNTTHQLLGMNYSGSVNSFHKFGVKLLPEDFSILAYTLDGSIEAIRHKNLPWIGWMWHPERGIIPDWMKLALEQVLE
jgi:gamma-glutamyl-gamma-aminobutyrate hydrolase PuuD